MDLVLTAEQEDLQATVRRLLDERSPMRRVRQIAEGEEDHDADLWKRMAALGLTGLLVPERYGGSEAGYVEASVVLEEMGRALVPSPFVASAVLAATALLAADDEEVRARILPGIAAGDTIATVAFGAGPVLGPVLDGAVADVVVAIGDSGVSLASGGFTATRLAGADPTRSLARIDIAGAEVREVTADARAVAARVADVAAAAMAAEQVGGLLRCLRMTVDYAKVRMQFGRPIGSFQAVKHTCADMYCAAELAYSAVRHASWAADHDPEGFPVAASVAKAYCSEAYATVTAQTVQMHGGIGFTWEHDAHLYYKRARSSRSLFGDPDHHRARLAERLGV